MIFDKVGAEKTHFCEGDLSVYGSDVVVILIRKDFTFMFHAGSSSAASDSVIPSSAKRTRLSSSRTWVDDRGG